MNAQIAPLINAEDFRTRLCVIASIDGDVMERAGFCPDTIYRMMRDPFRTFQRMTTGERARFWPLVEASIERTKTGVIHERV